jgi:Putative MetA-pathway of phenol degradation
MKTFGVTLASLLISASAGAQDLEPRAYSPSPVGTTFIVISATRSAGGVFTDPSAPISNVEATLGILGLTCGRTFDLFGRQALLLGIVPVAWGEASGDVGEDKRTASRRGLADPRLRLSVILKGSPAMTPAEFAKAPRRTILGVSLTVAPPLGQYDSAKLVNLGANRWSVKPEIGLSYPAGRWTVDLYGAALLFSANDEYFPGSSVRRQDAIFAVQSHLSYTFARRYWIAVNGTWYSGGRSIIDGVDKEDLQRNTRLGATLAIPVGVRQSIKVAYSGGATTRIGADFRTVTVAWQVVFF